MMQAEKRTFVENARRAQLIDVTIELVAKHGYANVSLSRIAESADITKAAVLYHFRTKDAVVDAAYQHVLDALVGDVSAAVEAADVRARPAAYVRAMVAHLAEHPRHTRMLIEARSQAAFEQSSARRWGPLADLIATAADARGSRQVDARTLAIMAGGAIDAIVVEHLRDPGFSSTGAAESLGSILNAAMTMGARTESQHDDRRGSR